MKKILKYLSWLPFAVSIGSLILYLRYFIMFKLDSNLVMTEEIKETLNQYLILVFVSLFIGLLVILFKKILNLVNTKDTKKVEKSDEVLEKIDDDFINAIEKNSRILTGINNESNFMKYVKTNKVIKVKLSEPILGPSVKGKVVDTNEDIEILLLDDDVTYLNNKNNVIDSVRCPKCNNVINKDAFICTNCGILLNKDILNDMIYDFKEERKEYKKEEYITPKPKKFNFLLFVVNFMVIVLCIFLIFLISNKIINQRNENIKNINIVTQNEQESIN